MSLKNEQGSLENYHTVWANYHMKLLLKLDNVTQMGLTITTQIGQFYTNRTPNYYTDWAILQKLDSKYFTNWENRES